MLEEDSAFRKVAQELCALHENEVAAMEKELQRLRAQLGPVCPVLAPSQQVVCAVEDEPAPPLESRKRSLERFELPQKIASKTSLRSKIDSARNSSQGDDGIVFEDEPSRKKSSKSHSPKDKFPVKATASASHVELEDDIEEDRKLARCLVSDRYELILGAIVLGSIVIMAVEFQFTGYVLGQELGFKDMSELPPGEENPVWVTVTILALDIFFFLEVAFRVCVLRCLFFKLAVNWIDFVVVVLSLTVDLVELAGGLSAGINIWVLRLFRLAKIARALRIARLRRALESLSLLLRCVQSSLQVLFWSLGLLAVIQCIAGMAIGQMLVPYMRDETIDVDLRLQVYTYFGTFNRMILTMFEVLFANWAIPARICVENVGEVFVYIFIFYRCLVGFAVLNVVSAVFVQQTMKVAQQDQEYMMSLKQKQAEAYAQKLKRFFMTLDASGDGLLSWDEFSVLLHDPQLQIWMSTLDLETHDLVQLFQMIDDGDGEISVEEFIDGATRLRGMARSLDVAQVLTSIRAGAEDRGRKDLHLMPAETARGLAAFIITCEYQDWVHTWPRISPEFRSEPALTE